ncbi:hypothetical protein PF438_04045 [Elizabethkingia meningoseptica]|uniref:hypothetical protein n=1 Tax=Elizabethkingia meningoseptica TaxID=238 RepID=UPI0022F197C8|nr:hypothetical protein [Elizabethkingia meningoseptica]EJK5330555.1 hypothetical protein [Elizabethkingia meningoseptica]WBS75663.1 hypothetical protein PF438_04045 [Elizabethkingia meningoseptica]
MKRLEEIKNEYAKQWYKDWNDLEIDCQFHIGTLIGHTDKVTEIYAREVAQASLEKAAEEANMKYYNGHEQLYKAVKHVQIGADNVQIDKESITNPKNISLL